MQDTALLDTLHDITTKHTVTFEFSVGLQERSLHAGIQIRSHDLKQGHFPQSRTGEIHVSAQSRSAGVEGHFHVGQSRTHSHVHLFMKLHKSAVGANDNNILPF